MTIRICVTCGVQQSRDGDGWGSCPVCEDERQWVPEAGQQWISPEDLRAKHRVEWQEEMEGVWSLRIEPHFGIGQRAFLIRGPGGNILWDCIALLDDATRARIEGMGGLAAVAISHPHYYSAMADWGRAFDAPVHLHADDADWIQQPSDTLNLWTGETLPLGNGRTLIRCGGHFAGAAVLHVADGDGTLFSGDTIQVVQDRRHVSFMRSYPNIIPLDASSVRRIAEAVEPYAFDAVLGAFPGRTIRTSGKDAVRRSAERYIRAIEAPPVETPLPSSRTPNRRIVIHTGDITELMVDAIVNAANEGLTSGGGVCGAIHRAAGPGLAVECAEIGHCPAGSAVITEGHDLAPTRIVHAVGPVWQGGGKGEPAQLALAYARSLQLAAEKGCRTVAFPAISTGIYGYPPEAAARIAVQTVSGVLKGESRMRQVVLCCFTPESAALHQAALDALGE